MRKAVWTRAAVAMLLLGASSWQAHAQEVTAPDTIALSLHAALERALDESEEVRLARAQVAQADASIRSARSAMLPQVNTQLLYTRALRSVFQDAGFELPDSLKFEPDSTASLLERVQYLEENVPNAAFGALGGLFGNLPFGREHTWNAIATVQQPIFSLGILSGVQLANSAHDAAVAAAEEAEADVALHVTRAYLDAVLAEESAVIVAASLDLAQSHLSEVRLQLSAGVASELDELRAEVELENLRPQLAAAENARDLAASNLKRLVNLPAESELVLTTPLDEGAGVLPAPGAADLPSLAEAAPLLERRSAVRAAEAQVEIREEQVDIARAAYLPNISLQGNFSRQAFPSDVFPSSGDWRDDWNVGLAVSWPLFQGFRRNADVDVAQAQVQQATLQLAQLEESVRLEYDRALRELERSQLQIAAADRTVSQAERVYELTELRYREGLATQLDVSSARLALQQARLNQATAYHDYYVALASAERALGRSLAAPNNR